MKRVAFFLLLFSTSVSAQEKIDVFFDFDRYHLNNEARLTLDEFLEDRQLEVVRIYGYCDSKGTNGYNDTLSQKRVREVYQFLQNKGLSIRPDYESKAFGEDFEQAANQSENRRVTVTFAEKRPVSTGSTLTEQMKGLKPGDKIRLKNINFLNNSAVIVSKSKPLLYELLCIMEENPSLKIEIQGHICCQLRSDENDVSTARARAIYTFLIRNKIDKKRLSYKGYGVSRPIHKIPEQTEEQADENRRVEILIVEI